MKLKKLVAVVLAVSLLLLAFTGCGGDGKEKEPAGESMQYTMGTMNATGGYMMLGTAAVSYTHLDVYKRQEAGLTIYEDVQVEWLANHSDVNSKLLSRSGTIAMIPEPFVSTALSKSEGKEVGELFDLGQLCLLYTSRCV